MGDGMARRVHGSIYNTPPKVRQIRGPGDSRLLGTSIAKRFHSARLVSPWVVFLRLITALCSSGKFP